jgi:oligoribonuclease (3'-5' exoribonuclease)
MTGLNLGKDKIIEIAAIITNKDLDILDSQGFERVIHCPENMMNNMDEWCTEQHGKVQLGPTYVINVVWINSTCPSLEKLYRVC